MLISIKSVKPFLDVQSNFVYIAIAHAHCKAELHPGGRDSQV